MVSLREVMNQSLAKWVRVEKPRVRPSSLGSCLRKSFFFNKQYAPASDEFIDVPLDSPEEVFNTGFLAAGKVYELFVTPVLIEHGFTSQPLVIIDKERGFYGHADFAKVEGDVGYIIDIKTTSFHSLPFLPHDGHILQVQSYLHGMLHGEVWETDDSGECIRRLPTPKKCFGALFYILRENPAYVTDKQEFWYEYDPNMARRATELFDTMRYYIENDIVPEIPPGYSPFSFPCFLHNEAQNRWCPYWKLCWGDKITDEVDEIQRELAIKMIEKYVEKKRVSKEYEELRKTFIHATQSQPNCQVVTPLGSVAKRYKVGRRVDPNKLMKLLVDEGYLTWEQLNALKSSAQVVWESQEIRICPNWALFGGDGEYEQEEQESQE